MRRRDGVQEIKMKQAEPNIELLLLFISGSQEMSKDLSKPHSSQEHWGRLPY